MCGSVSGPSDQLSSAAAITSGAWPSGPPIRKARSRPCCRQASRRSASCSEEYGLPRPSRDTTWACLGKAASTRAPSSAIARAASRPLPRMPGGDFHQFQRQPVRQALLVIAEAAGDPVRRALADGDQARLHRDPFGRTITRQVTRRDIGRLVADGPQALERIELAHARQHHVHDHVAQVDQHPFGFALAFDAERHHAALLGELHDFVGHRFHVAGGGAGNDDEVVGDAGLAAHVDLDGILGFHFFQRCMDLFRAAPPASAPGWASWS